MSYPITHIEGLDADEARTLKAAGIRTTDRLLEQAKGPKERRALAKKTGIEEARLLRFANACDHMRIKGMGKGYVGLLREVGVHTVGALKYRNPAKLAQAMAEANKKRKLVMLVPSEKMVNRWVEHAKKLPNKITHR